MTRLQTDSAAGPTAVTPSTARRVLVGGVGYHNLRDLSLGPLLTRELAARSWPAGVAIDHDLSFGPISIVHRFRALDAPYDRVVLFGAVERGRAPGTITVYRWAGELPPAEEIQARIAEAVTGVVSLDNLLIVGEQFGIWPAELFVVEVEPGEENWGEGFSPAVTAVLDDVVAAIRRAALSDEE